MVWALSAPLSLTAGPAVCVQEYLAMLHQDSLLPLPSKVTLSPALTVWLAPATAVGGLLLGYGVGFGLGFIGADVGDGGCC